MDEHLKENKVDGALVYEGHFLKVQRDVIRLPDEDHLTCAKRELKEETGYTASEWHYVCTIHNAIAYSDEFLDLYLARGLKAGERELDDGEFLDVYKLPLTELLAQIRAGKVTDVKTVIGAFWLEKIVNGEWTPAAP